MMQSNNLTITLLLPLLLVSFLACADTPTQPTLTEEEIRAIVLDAVASHTLTAEELTQIVFDAIDANVLSPEDVQQIAREAVATDYELTPVEIAEIAMRSTVYLQINNSLNTMMNGSGFMVHDGLIVTAHHVIEQMRHGGTAMLVRETKTYPIDFVVAIDEPHDLAIIRASNLVAPSLMLGNSDEVRIGESVFVIGNPDKHIGTFATGVVSRVRFDDPFVVGKVLQMTAPISRGSSGSPVLNDRGELIGIAKSIDVDGQLLNFAIPVNALKSLLATLD